MSGWSAATASGEASSTRTWFGPCRYSSTGRPDSSTPSTASNSSARSYGSNVKEGCRIQPKTIRDPSRSQLDRHDAGAGLEPDLVELERAGQHERGAQDRMPGERQLERRREDADPRIRVAGRRVDEDGLGEVDLARELLQAILGDLARVGEDRELGCPRTARR